MSSVLTKSSTAADYLDSYFPSFHRVAASAVESVSKQGYLTKQGGRIATWKRRWCVLSGGDRATLYYYARSDDATPKGFIPLEGCALVRLQSKKKFSFVIKHPQRRHFFINCDTEQGFFWILDFFFFLKKNTRLSINRNRFIFLVVCFAKRHQRTRSSTANAVGFTLAFARYSSVASTVYDSDNIATYEVVVAVVENHEQ